MADVVLSSLLPAMVFMAMFFILAQVLKDNSIVDIAWGLGFILVAWFSFFYFPLCHWRKVTILCMVSLWGIRLAGYIWLRRRG